MALFVAFVAAALLAQWLPVPRQDPKEVIRLAGILLGAAFLFGASYLDDRFELRPGPQYLAHALASIIAILFLVFIERVMNPFTDELYIFPSYALVVILTMLWIMGMINTINIAAERDAYTMTDRGTFIKYADNHQGNPPLVVLVEGDATLFNQYSALGVNPSRCENVKYDLAKKFIAWMASDKTQKLIADFKLMGKQLFIPNAK